MRQFYGAAERQDERAATLSGLMGLLFVSPRVARSSQPWAERCNPFGIERHGLEPQKLVALVRFSICAIRELRRLIGQEAGLASPVSAVKSDHKLRSLRTIALK